MSLARSRRYRRWYCNRCWCALVCAQGCVCVCVCWHVYASVGVCVSVSVYLHTNFSIAHPRGLLSSVPLLPKHSYIKLCKVTLTFHIKFNKVYFVPWLSMSKLSTPISECVCLLAPFVVWGMLQGLQLDRHAQRVFRSTFTESCQIFQDCCFFNI